MTGALTFHSVPLSVLNRALDLFGVDREGSIYNAWEALISAQGRKDYPGPYTPLAIAVAECMSLSGPWSEKDGEYAGEGGYSSP